jgi:polyphosphate:AMP phosphotransferase
MPRTPEKGVPVLAAAEVGNRLSKKEYRQVVPDLRLGLVNAQYDLRDADFPVIVLVAGDDRIAANAVVNRLNEWMDARYMRTFVFRERTAAERELPRFRRLWQAMPPRGRIAVWAGGLFQEVAALLAGERTEAGFDAWTRHLEALQADLLADGALIVKFFLHTPLTKQRARLKRAERGDEDEGWRVDRRDWAALETLDGARPVVERLLRRMSAPGAPWTVVESTDERYRDVTVARTILDALTARLAEEAPRGVDVSPALFAPAADQLTVLSKVDLSLSLERDAYRERLDALQARLHRLSLKARARGLSTVLAFEGWDAAGKGGVIRRVTQSLEAGDYRVIPTGAPTPEELRYHYLWRFWRDLPPAGTLVAFDRTWYGRVLVERVEELATAAEWQRAYDEINDFEDHLVEHGCVLQKFWLHISPEEQLARFEAREATPYKQHKITDDDWRNRERWDAYVEAVDQMVLRTSSEAAPWNIIPANDKHWARIAVLERVTDALKAALKR